MRTFLEQPLQLSEKFEEDLVSIYLVVQQHVFSFQNKSKSLDPTYKVDGFGRGKSKIAEEHKIDIHIWGILEKESQAECTF